MGTGEVSVKYRDRLLEAAYRLKDTRRRGRGRDGSQAFLAEVDAIIDEIEKTKVAPPRPTKTRASRG